MRHLRARSVGDISATAEDTFSDETGQLCDANPRKTAKLKENNFLLCSLIPMRLG